MRIEIAITIHHESGKENLKQMRDKYLNFRDHVEDMQLAGWLPRGTIDWTLRAKGVSVNVTRPPKSAETIGPVVPPGDSRQGVLLLPSGRPDDSQPYGV